MVMPDDQPTKRVKLTILVVQDDYIKLKAEQVRLSANKPSPVSLSDMAHQQWLRRLPHAPKNFRVRKRKSPAILSAAS